MLTKIKRSVLRRLISIFPSLSSRYSTVDAPQEVPVQVAAYQLIAEKYLHQGDKVLDVGFGLGYGMRILAGKAEEVYGIEVDDKALSRAKEILNIPKIKEVKKYDGYNIPYTPGSFDLISCVDVLEHVKDYNLLLHNLTRASSRFVVIATPIRRPEYTKSNGKPKNFWHLREWSFEELDQILAENHFRYEWNIINGGWDGPFNITSSPTDTSLALVPVIFCAEEK